MKTKARAARVKFAAAAGFAALGMLAWYWLRPRPLPPAADPKRALVESYLAQVYPASLSLFSDGNRILLRSSSEKGSELIVHDLHKNQAITSRASEHLQINAFPSPDGRKIAYLERLADKDDMALRIWTPADNGLLSPLIPSTRTSNIAIRWSPDGKYLALYCGSSGSTRLCVLNAESGTLVRTLAAGRNTDFAWEPGRPSLVWQNRERPGSLEIIDVEHGNTQPLDVESGAEISHVDATTGDYLVTARGKNDEYFTLRRIQCKEGRCRTQTVRKAEGDILSPKWIQGTKEFLYHVAQADWKEPWTTLWHSTRGKLAADQAGDMNWLGTSRDRLELMVQFSSLRGIPEVRTLDIETGKTRLVYRTPQKSVGHRTSPVFLQLKSADGTNVPAFLHKADPDSRTCRSSVIQIHGGPKTRETPAWKRTTQLLADEGMDVLTVNYRGSQSFGKTFENQKDLKPQSEDIAAAVAYLRNERKQKTILLLGHSYGTLLALRQAAQGTEIPVLVSIVNPDGDDGYWKTKTIPGPVLAFQGGLDVGFSPKAALNWLWARMGEKPNSLDWNEYPADGHSFTRFDSVIDMYTKLLALRNRSCR